MTAQHLIGQRVSLRAGHCTVLNQASFEIPLDGITLLRGANGAGKTTFLRALLGLHPIEHGTLHLLGHSPRQARRFIGYMPQKMDDHAPMLPVISHVIACLTGMRWGLPWSQQSRRDAITLLSLTGADHLTDRPLGVLSGGERQRVALAQALAHQPRLLILDEPLAALDARTRRTSMELFSHLNRTLGTALLMTAHESLDGIDISSALRDIWLDGGQLRA